LPDRFWKKSKSSKKGEKTSTTDGRTADERMKQSSGGKKSPLGGKKGGKPVIRNDGLMIE